MDMNLFISYEEARHVVQAAWRQYKTSKPGSIDWYNNREFIALARGQATEFGVTPNQIHAWENEIDAQLNR